MSELTNEKDNKDDIGYDKEDNETSQFDIVNEAKSCPYSQGKLCIQIDNLKELRALANRTARKVEGFDDDMQTVHNRVNTINDGLKAMMDSVQRTSDNIDKVFKLYYDKSLSDKDEFVNLKLKNVELEKMISEVSHKSDIDNMMQDHNIQNHELEEFKEKKKERKSIWSKIQLTALGIGTAYLVNMLIDFFKDLVDIVHTTPK